MLYLYVGQTVPQEGIWSTIFMAPIRPTRARLGHSLTIYQHKPDRKAGGKMAPYVTMLLITIIAVIIGFAIVEIPANPPRIALVKFLGRFTGKVKGAGYRIFIGRPFFWSYDEILTTTINHDFPEQVMVLNDNASVKVQGSITFAPAKSERGSDKKSLLIQYVENGKEDGVKKILEDSFGSRVREFFQSRHEGPQKWKEALESSDEGVFAVLRSLVGDESLGLTPQDVRTLTDFEGRSGIGLPDILRAHLHHGDPLSWTTVETKITTLPPAERNNLSRALTNLYGVIRGVRNGTRRTIVPGLGIVILRLNFDEIAPVGKVAEAAEKKEVERLEKEAEREELAHVTERIRALTVEYATLGIAPEVAVQRATELVQSERGKVPITRTHHTNAVDATTLRLIGEAAAQILRELRRP